jgi:hypothetical protein
VRIMCLWESHVGWVNVNRSSVTYVA